MCKCFVSIIHFQINFGTNSFLCCTWTFTTCWCSHNITQEHSIPLFSNSLQEVHNLINHIYRKITTCSTITSQRSIQITSSLTIYRKFTTCSTITSHRNIQITSSLTIYRTFTTCSTMTSHRNIHITCSLTIYRTFTTCSTTTSHRNIQITCSLTTVHPPVEPHHTGAFKSLVL